MAKSSVLIMGIGLLGLSGCGESGVDGNGERQDEQRRLAPFSRIRSDSELDVEVVQGDPAVLVSLDSNLQRLVKTRVADDTLYIETRDDIGEMVDGPHVLVSVPTVTAAKLAGSGSLALWVDEPEGTVELYLTGSGDLRFEGRTAAVGAFLSGSGTMHLEGTTRDAELALSGSGEISARNMSCISADIALSGSGEVSANASDSVRVSLTGSGDVELYGPASVDASDDTGSGDIVRR
jgi:Putative auto-transporter adhesin, head GIN domain